ncbi:MAG: hypothetical protein F6K14_30880 [Symploca sp. SIO2C1]|nr:hypothetical protein [Symploca sp. SIO2C1]
MTNTTKYFTKQVDDYTIEVVQTEKGQFYGVVLQNKNIRYTGSVSDDSEQAKAAAIRKYHILSEDLNADPSQIVQIDPELLVNHPRNSIIYANDESTDDLKEQLDIPTPYIAEYKVTPEGVIISGHRRNYVITQLLKPKDDQEGVFRFGTVPVIVNSYDSSEEEAIALVTENLYRHNKSEDTLLAEARMLQKAYAELGKRNQQTKGVKKGSKINSWRQAAEKLGVAQESLRLNVQIDDYINELDNQTLLILWKKVKIGSLNAAIALREAREKDKVSDEILVRACQLLTGEKELSGKKRGRLSAQVAIQEARKQLEEERALEEEKNLANPATSSDSEPSNPSESSDNGLTALQAPMPPGAVTGSPKVVNSNTTETGAEEDVEPQTEAQGESFSTQEELFPVPADFTEEQKERWIKASNQQKTVWTLAREAIAKGDDPKNNRLTPPIIIDNCLEVVGMDEFDYDVFADLTNLDHIPSKYQYSIREDFTARSKEGEYINKAEGTIFANIPWNRQSDAFNAIAYWIKQDKIQKAFIVSQASCLNINTTQKIIKDHDMVVASWKGRLEYEPGNILYYDCQFPSDGSDPKIPSAKNQRYETVILFYTKSLEEKLKFERVFSPHALVTFQRSAIAEVLVESDEKISKPVWVGNDCNWQGFCMRVEQTSEGLWDGYLKAEQDTEEDFIETLPSDVEMKAFLMSRVLLEMMDFDVSRFM